MMANNSLQTKSPTLKKRLGRLRFFIRHALRGIAVHSKATGDDLPPRWSRTLHQLALLARAGISAKEYYLHKLWSQRGSKTTYIGELGSFEWQTVTGDINYTNVFDDKLLFDVVARVAGLQTADIACVYSKVTPALDLPVYRRWEDFATWLTKAGNEHLFLKPLKGIRGIGGDQLRRAAYGSGADMGAATAPKLDSFLGGNQAIN